MDTSPIGVVVFDARTGSALSFKPPSGGADGHRVRGAAGAVNAGRVATYGSLQRQAWRRFDGTVKPKLVHAPVKRLRGKLGEGGEDAVYVRNVRGVGYEMPAPGREE